MIPVKETSPGVFERLSGNPVLLSLDGRVRAPLRTILHKSWTAEDRAKFGVHLAVPFVTPEGKRAVDSPTYEKRDGVVVEVRTVADVIAPGPDTRTPTQKAEEMAARFGLTLDELRTVLGGGR